MPDRAGVEPPQYQNVERRTSELDRLTVESESNHPKVSSLFNLNTLAHCCSLANRTKCLEAYWDHRFRSCMKTHCLPRFFSHVRQMPVIRYHPVALLIAMHKVEDVKQTSSLPWRKIPKLYVEVACNDLKHPWKLKEISSLSPQWNETVPLDVEDTGQSLHFRLRRHALLRSDPAIGMVSVKIEDLISQSTGAVEGIPLILQTSKQFSSPLKIWLSAKESNVKGNAEAALGLAQVAVDVSDIRSQEPEIVDHTSAVLNNLSSLSKNLGTVAGVIADKMGDLAELHPYANIAWKACSSLYDVVKQQRMNDDGLLALVKTMDDTFSFAGDLDDLPNKIKRLESVIARVLQQIAECAFFIREYASRSFTGRILEQLWKDQESKLREFMAAFKNLQKDLDSGTLQHNTFVTSRISEDVSKILESEYIKLLKPSPMNLATRKTCLAGTRTQILDEITQWIIRPSEKNILWLHGAAGSGKSTIASTIAQYFYYQRRRGAYLFFERSTSDPFAFMRTLAHKLAEFDSNICTAVSASIKQEPGIVSESLLDQFTKLLSLPLLEAAEKLTGPIIIVLDGLDECGDEASRAGVLKLLGGQFHKLPSTFRFLVTSRLERDIDAMITSNSQFIEQLVLTVGADKDDSDIKAFISSEMKEIRELNVGCGLSDDWPGQDTIHKLARFSEGLFIWVSTMSKFLREESSPIVQLDLLLGSAHSIQGLDPLYSTALETSCRWQQEQSMKHFQSVIAVILFSRELLDDHRIDRLLGLADQDSCRFILARLRCVLDYSPGKPIRPFHASFRDYLTGANRSGGKPWSLSSLNPEHLLASCCFHVMLNQLHFNMCKVRSSHHVPSRARDFRAIVTDSISLELRYACIRWSNHLSAARTLDDTLISLLRQFSHKKVLFWLEAVSIIKQVRWAQVDPSHIARSTTTILKDYDPALLALWNEVQKLIHDTRHFTPALFPHIYLSALPFTPPWSKIRKIYGPLFPNTIQVFTKEATSNDILGMGGISHLSFSPDGRMLVSCFGDGSVQIRRTSDYALLPKYKNLYHLDGIKVAKLSYGNSNVIYGLTGHGALVVWDVESTTTITLKSASVSDFEVQLLPSGEHILAVCGDRSLYIWSRENLDLIFSLLEIKVADTNLTSIAIANSGQVAVSGPTEEVMVLDIELAQPPMIIPLRMSGDDHPILAFSSDNMFLAIASSKEGVFIWCMETENIIRLSLNDLSKPASHDHCNNLQLISTSWINSEHILFIGFSDGITSLFNVDTKQVTACAVGEIRQMPVQVAASPDGTTLATGSSYIRIWDSTILQQSRGISANDIQGNVDNKETCFKQFPSEWLTLSDHLNNHRTSGCIWDPWQAHLLYIPSKYQDTLYWLGQKHIIGPMQKVRLDLSRFVHGERWSECYKGNIDK
ncbi:hypothetical protein QCA50_010991 [Cerrena zonata]|uniref:C2 domain-containing protein n=1 Tax=Cerrena zonata TaxID=2478898 RepID=A0AAW0G7B7_9APHY